MGSATRYYKLTDEKGQTYGGMKWGEGVTHKVGGKGKTLCSEDVIHVYAHPLLAALLNPVHANFDKPILWECECSTPVADDGTKIGVKVCTTLRRLSLPVITTNQRVRFAILCALEVYKEPAFVEWAKGWLSGTNRDKEAAEAAARAARAAEAAARAAAWAAEAAWAAAWAAEAARAAAWAAAWAAKTKINLIAIVERAIAEEES